MKRILVVDGDTGVRARIAKHARMEGYDVTEAGDGETASACPGSRTHLISWSWR